jgi:hypothetical protein
MTEKSRPTICPASRKLGRHTATLGSRLHVSAILPPLLPSVPKIALDRYRLLKTVE